jgi:hypothetical protein
MLRTFLASAAMCVVAAGPALAQVTSEPMTAAERAHPPGGGAKSMGLSTVIP